MNNFREWLSDNLRYILLILGVLAVLVGMFFGIREIATRMNTDSGQDVINAGSAASAAQGAVSAPESAGTVLSAAESAVSGAEVESLAEAALGHGELLENSIPAVTTLMKNYYEAVNSQDIAAIRELADTLPEETATELSSSTSQYSDIQVYTKNGLTEDSCIAYTYYKETAEGSDTALPGLSQSYIRKDADGNEKIVFSALDKETETYIREVSADEDVQALINRVKEERTAAVQSGSTSAASSDSVDEADSEAAQDAGADDAGEDADTGETADADDGETDNSGDGAGEDDAADEGDDGSDDYNEDDGSDDYDEGDDYDANDGGDDYYEEEEEYAPSEWTGTVKSTVNVRSGPGFDYEVIAELDGGTNVTVFEEVRGWYHVYYDGIEGYVGHSWIY